MQGEMQEARECQQKAMHEMEARHRHNREVEKERHQLDLEHSRKEMRYRFARLEELVSEGVRREDI
ncbi:hypothetical protein Scep_016826 [Stephania cephalantha]|uniref:Uncharacterized protein n=1 Tax=Stephania cephalantha TaxID=152367 RepID=A0AAP0NTP2_9MAGN